MFQVWQVHANRVESDWLGLLDASGTQTDESQLHNALRVGARKLFYIPCADLLQEQ